MINKKHFTKQAEEWDPLVRLNEQIGRGQGCGAIIGDVHSSGYLRMWDSRSPSRFGHGVVRGAGNRNGTGVG